MEEVLSGIKRFISLIGSRPKDIALFVFIVTAVSFAGFLPLLIANGSWIDSSIYVKSFYNAASDSVLKGVQWSVALDASMLGKAGAWVYANVAWKYAVLAPLQISLFLSLMASRQGHLLKGFLQFPKTLVIQMLSLIAILAVAVTGILLTIGIFVGAAAPFFMIIVLIAVLSTLLVLAPVPVAVVFGGIPVLKAFSFCLSNSMKFGWPILLALLVPSVLVSLVSGWLGNLGVVSDLVLCLFSMPQYCVLVVVYERMVADA